MNIEEIKAEIAALPKGCDIYGGDLDNPPLGETGLSSDDLKALANDHTAISKRQAAAEVLLEAVDAIVEAHWNGGDVRAVIRRFEKVRADQGIAALQGETGDKR